MNSDLRHELLCRAEQDQAARSTSEPDWEVMGSVDAHNLAWLKEVVSEIGWPGKSMVGEDGAHAAWLLAQHADSDPEFQRICLDLVTQAVACGEALPTELAYLTDHRNLRPNSARVPLTRPVSSVSPRRLHDENVPFRACGRREMR